MSLSLETTLGDFMVDLLEPISGQSRYNRQLEITVAHFLSLCRSKVFHDAPFHNIQRSFAIQLRPIRAVGREDVVELDDVLRHNRHDRFGLVGLMVREGGRISGDLYITTATSPLRSLDERGIIIGRVRESGHSVIRHLDRVPVDPMTAKPLEPVSIKKTRIVDYPEYIDRTRLDPECQSPSRHTADEEEESSVLKGANNGSTTPENADAVWEREQRLKLQVLGDRSAAIDTTASTRTLFVARLNPLTDSDDLKLVFSRFGRIVSCEVKKGASGNFAFIEFADRRDCDVAVQKMDGVVLDDRRIRVDYSHSGHSARSQPRNGDNQNKCSK